MPNARLRQIAYCVCMVAAILLAAGFFLYRAAFLLPDRYTSIHPASTVPPMMGFAADSIFNTGDAEELDALPGVGEVIAQRIIDLRQVLNGYRIPEDLLLVKGIGEKTLNRIMTVLPEQLAILEPMHE